MEDGRDEVDQAEAPSLGERLREKARQIREARERTLRARRELWPQAAKLVFDAHVRRVHVAVRENMRQFLKGPGHGEPLVLRSSGPSDEDVQAVVDAMIATGDGAYEAGLADGREALLEEQRRKNFEEQLAAEAAAKAKREARKKTRKKARR